MAGRSRSTFGKRQKEQKRQEKRREKIARKEERKLDKQTDQSDLLPREALEIDTDDHELPTEEDSRLP